MNSIILILTTQFCMCCTEPNIYHEVSSVSRKILNSSKHQTTSYTIDSMYNSESTSRVSAKKWQVGRVSRNHYEIVNMLWRKTKIFLNPESTTEIKYVTSTPKIIVSTDIKSLFTSLWLITPSSTPSYIEFYYLDDNDDRIKRRESIITRKNEMKMQQEQVDNNSNSLQGLELNPILSFRINDPISKITTTTAMQSPIRMYEKNKKQKAFRENHPLYDYILRKLESKVTVKKKTPSAFNLNQPRASSNLKYETCPATIEENEYNTTLSQSNINNSSNDNSSFSTTTINDKIKFFEIYDQHTDSPIGVHHKISMFKDDYIDRNHTALLDNINKNLGYHDGLIRKFVKKHIEDDFQNDVDNDKIKQKSNLPTIKFHENKKGKNASRTVSNKKTSVNNPRISGEKKRHSNISKGTRIASKLALWSDYPFAAVYIYEPSQIHCDAAALSPHWLVAAGSCLSRFHRKDPMTGRTAFVVYCSQNWWIPERVSYVKYSVVHPRYHPKDNMRRYLYNIGLIQVVGSMSSCFGWAPVSLISHHFAAGADGSAVAAVGWGLDRYDVRYSLSNLPKKPLSVYSGIIYSTLCPGNSGYRKLKSQNEDIIKNIYCLLLPHYEGEENDPTHGTLLLVGGKLIALYIEEERRGYGVQSAQYTSIWRLVQWIHEVAKEPDDDLLEIDV